MEGGGGGAETASVRLVLASSSARGALTKTAIRRPTPARFGRGGSVRDRSLQPPRGETARDWLTVPVNQQVEATSTILPGLDWLTGTAARNRRGSGGWSSPPARGCPGFACAIAWVPEKRSLPLLNSSPSCGSRRTAPFVSYERARDDPASRRPRIPRLDPKSAPKASATDSVASTRPWVMNGGWFNLSLP